MDKSKSDALIEENRALREALQAARDSLEELAKETQATAIAMQNKAVTGYMRARDALTRIVGV